MPDPSDAVKEHCSPWRPRS